jgi:ubiquinone/menaquinone biosynthesis C-methylase UbiE
VNPFSSTLWESGLRDGAPYKFHKDKQAGRQFICDAIKLPMPNDTYDCVIARDALEHFANPLKALIEWRRVLKNGGCLLILVPFKDNTFDHKRPYDDIGHMKQHYLNDVSEADLSHVNEIVKLHDIHRDKPAKNTEYFRKRSEDNARNRALHQFVYNFTTLHNALSFARYSTILCAFTTPHDQIILGTKS